MTPKESQEAHFWNLFDNMVESFFLALTGIDAAKYAQLTAYRRGEASRRPMSQAKLIELRAKLLDNLDVWERENIQGILQ